MQVIFYASGMPFRDEVIQVFALDVNEHNDETGVDTLIHAIGTLKIDGAVTVFKAPTENIMRDDVIFTNDDIIDLRGWELISVQSLEEFNSKRLQEMNGFVETDIDDNY